MISASALQSRSLLLASMLLPLANQSLAAGVPVQTGSYEQTNLVSNIRGVAAYTDRLLVNPWGIALAPAGLIEDQAPQSIAVADNGNRNYTLYDPTGVRESNLVISGPPGVESNPGPTGIVPNLTGEFLVEGFPAPFLFVTEDGTISVEFADVNGDELPASVLAIDNSSEGAEYTGAAILSPDCCAPFLAVANFHGGFIETYIDAFLPLGIPGTFLDTRLPAGYAPYNVQVVGNEVFVTYAPRRTPLNTILS
jgi:uncharacterized protein (TIGR03118 family)